MSWSDATNAIYIYIFCYTFCILTRFCTLPFTLYPLHIRVVNLTNLHYVLVRVVNLTNLHYVLVRVVNLTNLHYVLVVGQVSRPVVCSTWSRSSSPQTHPACSLHPGQHQQCSTSLPRSQSQMSAEHLWLDHCGILQYNVRTFSNVTAHMQGQLIFGYHTMCSLSNGKWGNV